MDAIKFGSIAVHCSDEQLNIPSLQEEVRKIYLLMREIEKKLRQN